MKKIFIYILTFIFFSTNLFADSFNEALLKAYNKNPKLNAERENINISEEDINIAKSDFLPTVTLSGTKSKEDTNKLTNQSGGDAAISDVDPETKSLFNLSSFKTSPLVINSIFAFGNNFRASKI